MGTRGPLADGAIEAAQQHFPSGVPNPPAWLSRIAKAEYRRIVETLGYRLTQADYGMLVARCQAFGEIADHEKALRKNWETSRCMALARARAALREAEDAMGLTAKARVRLIDPASPTAGGVPPKSEETGQPSKAGGRGLGPAKFSVINGTDA